MKTSQIFIGFVLRVHLRLSGEGGILRFDEETVAVHSSIGFSSQIFFPLL